MAIRWALLLLWGWTLAASAEPLLVQNVTIISPERAEPLVNVDVLVSDGLIAEIGDDIDPGSARVIDGSGRYLVPGLIDSHVHLYHATGLRRGLVPDAEHDRLKDAYLDQLPRSLLHWGYTTVVELNASASDNAHFRDQPIHPRLVHCGQAMILSNGFMAHELGANALERYPGFLHDRFTTPQLPPVYDPAEHTPDAALAEIIAAGGRCVKLYHEPAPWLEGGATWSHPSVEILREVVAVAGERGMTVFLHTNTAAGFALGMDAGVDVLAHGLWEWGNDPGDPAMPAAVERALARAARTGQQVQPTIRAIGQSMSLFQPDVLGDPAWNRAVPADFLAYLRGPAQAQRQSFVEIFAARYAPDAIPGIQRTYYERYLATLLPFADAGGRLLFGTDTSAGTFGWGNPPGLNGYWEMQDWAKAGIPLATIFAAATIRNAEALGLAHEIGTVSAGKRADLLVLRDNPLERVTAWDDIEWVVVGGRAIERGRLAAH